MSKQPLKPLSLAEFVALLALMTSLVALSIDAMLPALDIIGRQLGVSDPNQVQLIIAYLFMGLGVGQLFFGPLSDRLGRKPTAYIGLCLFVAGCALSMWAPSFELMLGGRFLQGLGLAGPRVVSMAMVRDQYQGREMARVMSFIMTVFIIVPALAPSLGQLVLWLADWRMIYASLMALAVVVWLWLGLRQAETLKPELRRPFRAKDIARGFWAVLRHPTAIGYTLAAGCVSGAFVAFLATSQQVLSIQLGGGEHFPLLFAALALCLGTASVVNGRIVIKYGMRYLARRAIFAIAGISIGFALLNYFLGEPSLLVYMLYLASILFCVGMVFGNMGSIAMEPLGALAGIGAAVVGSVSTLVSFVLAVVIGSFYQGSVLPLVLGFCFCAVLAFAITVVVEKLESESSGS